MKYSKILKQILLTGAFSCFSVLAFAQGPYVKIGGGYNFGVGSSYGSNTTFTSTYDPATNTAFQTDRSERVHVNFGKGITGTGAIGYMFNGKLGTELEVSYLDGEKNATSLRFLFDNSAENNSFRKTKMHSRFFLVQPALVMVTSISEKLNLYGKFGIVASRGTIFMNTYQLDENSERIKDVEFKGGWGFGLQAGLGLSYKLNDKFAVFSEIKMSNLSYSPTSYQLKKETFNGEDITSTQPQHISLQNSYSALTTQQNIGLKEPFICGYAGLNIGLKFDL